ncbi:hypothetical protein POX_b02547 [Penicillium oxalicum]|uniref:hypothetical protein n=1 Tax=Penicillium oxalicum TaxID=69781 RepID=UPI0020B7BB20|nr:hypothetical protein POX_b02547 [Penicillium oxalicum]KAI2792509.1 hypothetical protein POX_b02547 [Penicillium oxalicum]
MHCRDQGLVGNKGIISVVSLPGVSWFVISFCVWLGKTSIFIVLIAAGGRVSLLIMQIP